MVLLPAPERPVNHRVKPIWASAACGVPACLSVGVAGDSPLAEVGSSSFSTTGERGCWSVIVPGVLSSCGVRALTVGTWSEVGWPGHPDAGDMVAPTSVWRGSGSHQILDRSGT